MRVLLVFAGLVCVGCSGRSVSSGSGNADGSATGLETGVDDAGPGAEGASDDDDDDDDRDDDDSDDNDDDDDDDNASGSTGASDETAAEFDCVDGVYRGLYQAGGESTTFYLCDLGIFVAMGDTALIDAGYCESAWFVLDARLCGPGEYGHLGQHDHELRFAEIVDGPCIEGSCDEPLSGCGTPDEVCPDRYPCDFTFQDCGQGRTCVPTSESGLPPWTGNECIEGGKGAVGDPCTTLGGGECLPGLLCWREFDAEEGICAAPCHDSNAPCIDGGLCTDCFTEIFGPHLGLCLPESCGLGECLC